MYSTALALNVHQMMTVWMEQSAAQLSAVQGAAGKHVSNLSYQVTRASLIYEIINFELLILLGKWRRWGWDGEGIGIPVQMERRKGAVTEKKKKCKETVIIKLISFFHYYVLPKGRRIE